jgi:hypothetical protein
MNVKNVMQKLFQRFLVVTVMIVSLCGLASAEQPGKDWYVALRLGYQPFDLKASGKMGSRDFDVHTTLSDIMDKTDTTLAGGELEFGMGRWFMTLPASYIKIENQKGDTTLGTSASFKETTFNPMVGYRVYQQDMGGDQALAVDVLAGIFYLKASTDLTLFNPSGDLSFSGDTTIVDAMVGARMSYAFTKKFGASVFGEVGGGDSELQYVVSASLSYSFTDWFALFGGYKYWYVKYEDDSRLLSTFEQKIYGPVVGVQFKY